MHIPILTGIQKGHNSGYENDHILLKNVLLQINFQVFKVNCMTIATFIFLLFNLNPFFSSS